MVIKKILIVDDSPTERHVLNDMLTKAGYEVVASDNGEDAIQKAKSVQPDLILMDVVMPGLNGFQATRAISRDPETRSIPMIHEGRAAHTALMRSSPTTCAAPGPQAAVRAADVAGSTWRRPSSDSPVAQPLVTAGQVVSSATVANGAARCW